MQINAVWGNLLQNWTKKGSSGRWRLCQARKLLCQKSLQAGCGAGIAGNIEGAAALHCSRKVVYESDAGRTVGQVFLDSLARHVIDPLVDIVGEPGKQALTLHRLMVLFAFLGLCCRRFSQLSADEQPSTMQTNPNRTFAQASDLRDLVCVKILYIVKHENQSVLRRDSKDSLVNPFRFLLR